MERIEIQKLIGQCIVFFEEKCYSKNRIGIYKSLWKNGIVKFMQAKGLSFYSPPIGAEFVQTCHYHGTVRHQERELIRSVQVLDDMLNLGKIRKRCIEPKHFPLEGEIGKEMKKVVAHLINLRRSTITVNDYRRTMSEFLNYLNQANIRTVD